MVRLTRISSDFNIAKMRDSFMRQFMEAAGDADLGGVKSGAEAAEDDVTTSGKHVELPLLVDQRQKSLMGTPTRRAVVSSLIRCHPLICFEIFRHLFEDGVVIFV